MFCCYKYSLVILYMCSKRHNIYKGEGNHYIVQTIVMVEYLY